MLNPKRYSLGIEIPNSPYLPGNTDDLKHIPPKTKAYIDLETTKFFAQEGKVMVVVLMIDDNLWMIELETFKELFPYLDQCIFVGHNLTFDMRWLQYHKLYFNYLYDTSIIEKLFNNNPKKENFSLPALCKKYLGIHMDKTFRNSINPNTPMDRLCAYAEKDVLVLPPILDKQMEFADKYDMHAAIIQECRFIIPVANSELNGVAANVEAIKETIELNTKKLYKGKSALEKYIFDNNIQSCIEYNTSLFTDEPQVSINWQAPDDRLFFLKELGITLMGYDKKNKVEKEVAQTGLLKPMVDKIPILSSLIDVVEANHALSNFGDNFIKAAEYFPDHRIRTTFNTVLTSGRMSSGETAVQQERFNKQFRTIPLPNILNIPNEKLYRRWIIAPPGKKLLIYDYSGQEPKILAHFAQDPVFTKYLLDPENDMHSFMAKNLFKRLAHLSDLEVKEKAGPDRTISKKGNFAIFYGGNWVNIMNNCGVTADVAKEAERQWYLKFKGVKKWYDYCLRKTIQKEYILINPTSGRKVFIKDCLINYKNYISKERKTKEERKYYKDWFKKLVKHTKNLPIQGCLPESSKVLTKTGWKKLADFTEELVWTGNNWANAFKVYKGYAPKIKLMLSDGREFICDNRHKLLIYGNKAFPEWCHVKDILGKELVRDNSTSTEWGSTYLTEEDWYWAGRLLGDGFITKNGSWGIIFNKKELEDLDKFTNYLDSKNLKGLTTSTKGYNVYYSLKKGNKTTKTSRSKCNVGSVRIGIQDSFRIFESWHFYKGFTGNNKTVPEIVFSLNESRRFSFLKGWYDSDGRKAKSNSSGIFYKGYNFKRLTTAYLSLARQVVQLADTLGIESKISKLTRKVNSNKKEHFWYDVYFNKLDKPLMVSGVIELGYTEKMYTLSVEDSCHSFSNEGLISKNTGADMLKQSSIALWNYIKEKKYIDTVIIPVYEHDELIVEVPDNLVEEMMPIVSAIMLKAASVFCPSIPFKAPCIVADNWGAKSDE